MQDRCTTHRRARKRIRKVASDCHDKFARYHIRYGVWILRFIAVFRELFLAGFFDHGQNVAYIPTGGGCYQLSPPGFFSTVRRNDSHASKDFAAAPGLGAFG